MIRICQMHGIHLDKVQATVDQQTKLGYWAYMCDDCSKEYGVNTPTILSNLPNDTVEATEATVEPVEMPKLAQGTYVLISLTSDQLAAVLAALEVAAKLTKGDEASTEFESTFKAVYEQV